MGLLPGDRVLAVDGEAVPPGKAGIQTVVAATGGARLTLTRPSWLRGRRLDVTVIHRGWLGLEYSEHASGNFVMIATSGMGAAAGIARCDFLLGLNGRLLAGCFDHDTLRRAVAALPRPLTLNLLRPFDPRSFGLNVPPPGARERATVLPPTLRNAPDEKTTGLRRFAAAFTDEHGKYGFALANVAADRRGVRVKCIATDGQAAERGVLPGDWLLAVNGIPVGYADVDQLSAKMSALARPVLLLFERNLGPPSTPSPPGSSSEPTKTAPRRASRASAATAARHKRGRQRGAAARSGGGRARRAPT